MGINTNKLKSKIFILCNGELAEPLFFQAYKDHLKAHNIVIRQRKEFLQTAPWQFIEVAVNYKEELRRKGEFSSEDGDQLWCVFDVDRYLEDNSEAFRNALRIAEGNEINLAWSNECFEYWLLCHFALVESTIPRKDYHVKLKDFFKQNGLGKYEKNMDGIFDMLYPLQSNAIKFSKKVYGDGDPGQNPSTAVFLLVEEINRLFNC